MADVEKEGWRAWTTTAKDATMCWPRRTSTWLEMARQARWKDVVLTRDGRRTKRTMRETRTHGDNGAPTCRKKKTGSVACHGIRIHPVPTATSFRKTCPSATADALAIRVSGSVWKWNRARCTWIRRVVLAATNQADDHDDAPAATTAAAAAIHTPRTPEQRAAADRGSRASANATAHAQGATHATCASSHQSVAEEPRPPGCSTTCAACYATGAPVQDATSDAKGWTRSSHHATSIRAASSTKERTCQSTRKYSGRAAVPCNASSSGNPTRRDPVCSCGIQREQGQAVQIAGQEDEEKDEGVAGCGGESVTLSLRFQTGVTVQQKMSRVSARTNTGTHIQVSTSIKKRDRVPSHGMYSPSMKVAPLCPFPFYLSMVLTSVCACR